jgi:hypothetical protein
MKFSHCLTPSLCLMGDEISIIYLIDNKKENYSIRVKHSSLISHLPHFSHELGMGEVLNNGRSMFRGFHL